MCFKRLDIYIYTSTVIKYLSRIYYKLDNMLSIMSKRS